MKIPTQTITHRVGTCPACRWPLWAKVDVEVNVSAPRMAADGSSAEVDVRPVLTAMRMDHDCWKLPADPDSTGGRS